MSGHPHPRIRTPELTASAILWTLPPIPAPDRLAMSDEDLLVALIGEGISYRSLALAALDRITDLHSQVASRDRTIQQLREELRRYVVPQTREAA